MKIIPVTENNLTVYLNLAQCYEAEFSRLTHKKPDAKGLFELDTQLVGEVMGLLLMIDQCPVGIAAIAVTGKKHYEVSEFYIVPSFRHHSRGMKFAHRLWNMFPGEWEIKQIEGAQYASIFWRKTITAFNNTPYQEEHYNDPYWGIVTRQRFIAEETLPLLTDTEVQNAVPSDTNIKLYDRQGLYLLIKTTGGKLWRLKYRYEGIERSVTLGMYPKLSLNDARTMAEQFHSDIADDIDPALRRKERKHL
ncbi:MAG: integrase arm-type DNA-binding domain-containing protein [Sulfuricurvum sp.]|nr:integrase arm-type DNA-binding domain-containing protein [Sulfuricurvum sp.]